MASARLSPCLPSEPAHAKEYPSRFRAWAATCSSYFRAQPPQAAQGWGPGPSRHSPLGDVEAIQKECPAVSFVAPVHNGVAQIVYGNLNWSTGVVGTTPAMLEVRDWPLSAGRPFTDDDVRSATKVALLGQTVVNSLFGAVDPVGQIIRIKNIPFTVIGVLDSKGQSPQGQDQDDTIYIPVTTAQKKLFGTAFPGMIRIMMVKAKSSDDLSAAERQIVELLRQRHHIAAKQDDDFTVRNLTQIMQTAEQSTKVMTLLLGAIASVSLLVGGHRDHEYHAGISHGKNAGNRDTNGCRREDLGHQASIPRRGAYFISDRRHRRDYLRGVRGTDPFGACRMADHRITAFYIDGIQLLRASSAYSSGFILPTRRHCSIR